MIDWQIDTPIPMPPGLVVQNASKSRSKLSSFRPGPESCIAFVGFIACNLTPTYAVVVLMVVRLCKSRVNAAPNPETRPWIELGPATGN